MVRIRKETLERIISEEVRRGLREVTEARELDPADLIAFAESWMTLDVDTREQVKGLLDDPDRFNADPMDIELALSAVQGFNHELDRILQDYLSVTRSPDTSPPDPRWWEDRE